MKRRYYPELKGVFLPSKDNKPGNLKLTQKRFALFLNGRLIERRCIHVHSILQEKVWEILIFTVPQVRHTMCYFPLFSMLRTTLITACCFLGIPTASAAFIEDVTLPFAPALENATTQWQKLDTQAPMRRAELTAMVVNAAYSRPEIEHCFWDIASSVPPTFTLVFSDVSIDHTYAKEICIAMRDGLVRGFADGSFRPEEPMNMAEASKIIARAYALAPFADAGKHATWYEPYMRSLAVRNVIPQTITKADQLVGASDVREMLDRIHGDITWRPAQSYETLVPAPRIHRSVGVTQAIPSPSAPTKQAPKTGANSSLSSSASQSSVDALPSSRKSLWDLW